MAADLIQFVDSISSSPTVRLDLNDDDPWRCPGFSAPPPRLRRAMSQNAMMNGGFVSSSAYEMRTVSMVLDLRGTQDVQATQIQLLARELDRADNYLKYQPVGMTKPVFFRVVRSSMTDVEDVESQSPHRKVKVELLCEPFALGLRETLGPYTVNNDPSVSNGHYFDVSGVIGDVMAPAVIHDTTGTRIRMNLAVRQHGTPSDMVFFKQAESCTLGTDTANPGGGPDAAMAGTGTNNYVTTSFATTAVMDTRLTWDLGADASTSAKKAAVAGDYNAYAVVRCSNTSSVFNVTWFDSVNNSMDDVTVATPDHQNDRLLVHFGLVTFPAGQVGYDSDRGADAPVISIKAERVSGAGSLQWDYLLLLPADETTAILSASSENSVEFVIDGVRDRVSMLNNGGALFTDPLAVQTNVPKLVGRFPSLIPGRTNRVFVVTQSPGTNGQQPQIEKGDSEALTLYYWPAYLYVRPSAS